MKNKLHPVLAGSFVIGTLVLTVGALLSFRSCHFISKSARFTAYFNESVQGLDAGSAVKLRGVRVGRVLTIGIDYDANLRKSQVVVVGELDQDVISDRAGHPIKLTDRATLHKLIGEGLRAKIDLVGITGLQFVQLDFLDPVQFPALDQVQPPGLTVVPTVPSGMSELTANFTKIVANLKKVDFAGLSQEFKSLLDKTSRQVGDVDLQAMVAKVTAAAANIEALTGSAEAKAAFLNFNKTATNVQALAVKIDLQVEPMRSELVRTLHSFHEAAENVRQLLGPQSGLGEEAVKTLQQVTESAASLQELADFLERNPNALITGKKRPDKSP